VTSIIEQLKILVTFIILLELKVIKVQLYIEISRITMLNFQ